jgi:hypothetical protein
LETKIFAHSLQADAPVVVSSTFETYIHDTYDRKSWSAWLFKTTEKRGQILHFDKIGTAFCAQPPVGEGALVFIPEGEGCQDTELWRVWAKKIGPG